VELALAGFPPAEGGSSRLLRVLLAEYGDSFEARRQLCILFSLLREPGEQPVEALRGLLRAVENASIAQVSITNGGELASELWGNASSVELALSLAEPPGEDGRRAQLWCRLRALDPNCTRWAPQAAWVEAPGSGYSSDMELQPRLLLPEGVEVLEPPVFSVKLARPGLISSEQGRKLPGTLQRKFSALLPSSLLPTYSQRLGRLIPDQSVPMTPDPSAIEERRRLDEVFGDGRQVDRFRADFVFAEFDSTYGPVGISPLERERRLSTWDYWRLAVSGGLAGLLKELVFLPAKNVKFRLQTDAGLVGSGLLGAFGKLSQTEPWANFYRGLDVAALWAFLFGVVSFGATEFLRREWLITFPTLNEVLALALASAVSVFTALLLVTPLEVVMARVMSAKGGDNSSASAGAAGELPYWGVPVLQDLFRRSGFAALPQLYEEYWLLVSKELAFVVTKFVVFDSLREAVLFFVPAFAEAQSVLVACGCGAVAGAVAATVSHPIDTIFALRATADGDDSAEPLGLETLFRGVGARVLLFSPGIALTFLIYDVLKTLLGVGSGALLQTVDLLEPSVRG